jgi:release factor glutamine methyltransferase
VSAATWRQRHAAAAARLGSEREARWLVEEASGGAWPAVADEPVASRPDRRFGELVARRAAGEPLQYVLGHWAFRGLELMVDRRVLIPRPETEQVVEVALAALDRTGDPTPLVADLGTGSGAIALAVAVERPGATVWATDVSPDALDVASANLAGVGRAGTRVRLCQGAWWAALPPELAGRLALVVSNPPYVSSAEMRRLDPVVADWEPHVALDAGPDGSEAVALLVRGAPSWLAPGGGLVVEIAPHQADAVTRLAEGVGLVEVGVHPDLAGRPRALLARRPR